MIKLEPLTKEDFPKVLEWNKGTTPEFLLQLLNYSPVHLK